jgi:hypothetical protein
LQVVSSHFELVAFGRLLVTALGCRLLFAPIAGIAFAPIFDTLAVSRAVESNFGSMVFAASGAGSAIYSPNGTPAWSSSADDADYDSNLQFPLLDPRPPGKGVDNILLYDLTSTYFECDPPIGEADKRKFGHSRDKRSDGVQVVIALIVTPEGFPLAYEVLAGNTGDKTTLRDFLKKIEAHTVRLRGPGSWTVVMPHAA